MKRPLRLALCTTELRSGGAEKCLVELALRVDRARFAPLVVSLAPRPAPGQQELVARLAAADVPVHFLNARWSGQFLSVARDLARLLGPHNIDVLQTFLFHANILGARAARLAAVPVFAAGCRVADPRWWRKAVERSSLRFAQSIVCVGRDVASKVREQIPSAASRVLVIPNGIDLVQFDSLSAAALPSGLLPAGRKWIVAVGRLCPQKNFSYLLAEAKVFLPRLPDHDLVIAGEGPERDRLLQMARSPALAGRVHFLGRVGCVPSLLRAAELVVLSSRYEGMPNVVLEAMAAAKALAAAPAEGVAELLGDAADAQTIRGLSPGALAQRVTKIVSDPVLREQLGRDNRARAQHGFSLSTMLDRYQSLWESLLTASRTGP